MAEIVRSIKGSFDAITNLDPGGNPDSQIGTITISGVTYTASIQNLHFYDITKGSVDHPEEATPIPNTVRTLQPFLGKRHLWCYLMREDDGVIRARDDVRLYKPFPWLWVAAAAAVVWFLKERK